MAVALADDLAVDRVLRVGPLVVLEFLGFLAFICEQSVDPSFKGGQDSFATFDSVTQLDQQFCLQWQVEVTP